MGYYIKTIEQKFFLAAKDIFHVLPHFKDAGFDDEDFQPGINRVRERNGMLPIIKFDENNNIVGLCLDGKSGWQEDFFKKIAPFVKSGSYFVVTGESGEIWVWAFKNGECRRLAPKISWKWEEK